MQPRTLLLAAAIATGSILAAAGCDVVEPVWSRRLGLVMDQPPHLSSLIAPDVVTRGVPFEITVSTFGSSSCTLPDGYELTYFAAGAEVRVYDQTAPFGTPCTEDLRNFPRTVTVQFNGTGTAELRVVGRGHGEGGQEIKTIRKTIVVE